MADYTTLWEAFAGGWDDSSYGAIEPGATNWQQRSEDFYSQKIGPAFGAEDFGETTGFLTPMNIESVEQAEEQFRMSIGDPYSGTGQDPFAWETLSRYSPEEAQSMLEGQLYHKGKLLGGETGIGYGASLKRSGQEYAASTGDIGESLTYGGLTSDISLQSGTSGLALKTGSGASQAENILSDAYKRSKSLGETYLGEKGEALGDLKSNLSTALTTYIDVIDKEKEQWYENILSDVQRAKTLGTFDAPVSAIQASEGLAGITAEGTGLTYSGGQDLTREELAENVLDWNRQGNIEQTSPCGIGELYDPETGRCEVAEGMDLDYERYGYEDRYVESQIEEEPVTTIDESEIEEEEQASIFDIAPMQVIPSTPTVTPLPSEEEEVTPLPPQEETTYEYEPQQTTTLPEDYVPFTGTVGDPVVTAEEWEQFTSGTGSWGGGGGYTPIDLNIGGSSGFTYTGPTLTPPSDPTEPPAEPPAEPSSPPSTPPYVDPGPSWGYEDPDPWNPKPPDVIGGGTAENVSAGRTSSSADIGGFNLLSAFAASAGGVPGEGVALGDEFEWPDLASIFGWGP